MSTNSIQSSGLASLEYDKSYYEEHKGEGLDYLCHGYWQESYARMVSDATLQNTYPSPRFFDGGCACGSILQGFKKTGLYHQVLGIDLSEYMTTLGRRHFNFLKTEISAGSIDNIPLKDNSVTLVHSTQVLEHVPDEKIDPVLKEFARILVPGGRAFLCLDAIRHGESKEKYMGDPTHCNIKPVAYWTRKLFSLGLAFDVESYDRYARSKYGPTREVDMSFFQQYPNWSAWTLIKLN